MPNCAFFPRAKHSAFSGIYLLRVRDSSLPGPGSHRGGPQYSAIRLLSPVNVRVAILTPIKREEVEQIQEVYAEGMKLNCNISLRPKSRHSELKNLIKSSGDSHHPLVD